jgi:hypothetical protein
MARVRPVLCAFAVGVTLGGAAAPARAQPAAPTNTKVTAEALFVEGRRLVAAGQYAEACPKFADSERLDPSPATLLNLASCYERLGRTATAWATYREAASAANAAGRQELVATAQRHADALVPRLARMTINVLQPPEGIEVKRDGVVVDRAEWGTPIPLDPGSHIVAVSAPGYKPWSTTVDVAYEGAQAGVNVPLLDPLPHDEARPTETPTPGTPPSSNASPPAAAVSPATAAPPSAKGEVGGGGTQRAIGWSVGAIGVVSLGVGAGFAIAAKARYKDSLNHCPLNPTVCDSTGVSERNEARTSGDVATWTVIGGAVAASVGLVVVLTAPHGAKAERVQAASVRVAPALGGAVLEGTW